MSRIPVMLTLLALSAAGGAAQDAGRGEDGPVQKLTPFEECYSQLASERIAACTIVLDREEHTTPDRVTGFINRGSAYGQTGEMGLAIDDFERALVHDPRNYMALTNLGIAHAALKDYPRALGYFDAAIAVTAERAGIFALRANARRDSGAMDGALEDYARALTIDPGLAFAHHERGVAWAEKGEGAKALADFDKAIKLNPTYAAAYHNRGKLLVEQGHLNRAIRDFSAAIERRQTFAGAYFHRGRAHHLKGSYTRAIADYSKVLALSPGFAPAYNNRGRAWILLGRVNEAVADLEAATRLAPTDAATAELRAELIGRTVSTQ